MTGEPWSGGVRTAANLIGGACISAIGLLIWSPLDWHLWAFIFLMNLLSILDRTIAEGRS